MFTLSISLIWAIVICTLMLCYYSFPYLSSRNLRITFALSIFVAALAADVTVKPGSLNLQWLRFVAEMHWFSSTVAIVCLSTFVYRRHNPK